MAPVNVEWEKIETDGASSVPDTSSMLWIPGVFAGIVLLAIVMTGMMTLYSSMQEKRDKISETLLSSVSSDELMQGKIIGYFLLGILQVTLWLVIGLPAVEWFTDLEVISYLLVPELLLFLLYAVLGYLLFSAMYVAIGATLEDISTAGNFQGLVIMLPFLPFAMMWMIFDAPSGLVAQIGSYFPFTAPAVMIIRLVLGEGSLLEILLSLAVLIVSIGVMVKLAGKIYRIGILMYGKNATVGEIWKWLRQS